VRVGVPKEIKSGEWRVGLTPAGVRELRRAGHTVRVESDAGTGSGFSDDQYRAEGATIVASHRDVFQASDLVVKVKEPQRSELSLLNDQHVLFTYLHLAADPPLARALAQTGATSVAYETVVDAQGRLPLLAPMSEIAGCLAAHLAFHYLLRSQGGRGVLFGGIAGTPSARAVIVGGGVVGEHAAAVAVGLGARVTVLDRSIQRLRALERMWSGRIETAYCTEAALEDALIGADVVIGSVLLPGARAPKLIRREHLVLIEDGGVLVDVSIDQGGCAETSRPTTYSDPVYAVDGVRHAAITNLPAAAARTATRALTNATLPYVLRLAGRGVDGSLRSDVELGSGVNVERGEIVHPAVLASIRAQEDEASATPVG
jgi:alanine dehydrogenase